MIENMKRGEKRVESRTRQKHYEISRQKVLKIVVGCFIILGSLILLGNFQGAIAAEKTEDTLDRIERTGIFNLGVREATYPYGYLNAQNRYVGFSTEIAREVHARIEQELGTKIELNYIVVTGRTRIPLLLNKRIDLEAGATVITKGCSKVVDFSTPFFTTSTLLIVPVDSSIRAIEDLAGKRIGTPSGGLEERLCRSLNESGRINPPVKAIGYEDHPEGFQALMSGAVDAYFSDGPILYSLKDRASHPENWRVFNPKVNVFLQAFPMRKNSPRFKNLVDLTIVDLFKSGEWEKLFEKYFGPAGVAPYPKTDGLKFLELMNSWPE